MSYRIFYNKVAIRLKNGKYVFLELSGDNNYYEHGVGNRVGKRVRTWYGNKINGNYILSKEEILSIPEEAHKSVIEYQLNKRNENLTVKEIEDSFGWYCSCAVGGKYTSFTSYKDFYGFFSGGIKNAIDAEDFFNDDFLFNLVMISHYYSKGERVREIIKDEDTLIRLCEKYGNNDEVYLTFDYHYDTVNSNLKRFRQLQRKKRKMDKITNSSCFYTITDTRYFETEFIQSVSRYNRYISEYLKDCMFFKTKKQAEKYIKDKELLFADVVKIKKEAGKPVKGFDDYEVIDDPKF